MILRLLLGVLLLIGWTTPAWARLAITQVQVLDYPIAPCNPGEGNWEGFVVAESPAGFLPVSTPDVAGQPGLGGLHHFYTSLNLGNEITLLPVVITDDLHNGVPRRTWQWSVLVPDTFVSGQAICPMFPGGVGAFAEVHIRDAAGQDALVRTAPCYIGGLGNRANICDFP